MTRRAIRYQEASLEEFATTLEVVGVPADDAVELAHTFAATFDGRNAATTDGVVELLGRPARPFEAFARTAYAAGLLPSLSGTGQAS